MGGLSAWLHGRVSLKWQLVFLGDAQSPSSTSLKWAGQLVGFLLHYTQQLWTFQCGAVHGHITEESRQCHHAALLFQEQSTYEENQKIPSISPVIGDASFLAQFSPSYLLIGTP
jgi:hypothetical protein